MTDDNLSTHKVWYVIDQPDCAAIKYDADRCDCDLDFDHDEGQEVRD